MKLPIPQCYFAAYGVRSKYINMDAGFVCFSSTQSLDIVDKYHYQGQKGATQNGLWGASLNAGPGNLRYDSGFSVRLNGPSPVSGIPPSGATASIQSLCAFLRDGYQYTANCYAVAYAKRYKTATGWLYSLKGIWVSVQLFRAEDAMIQNSGSKRSITFERAKKIYQVETYRWPYETLESTESFEALYSQEEVYDACLASAQQIAAQDIAYEHATAWRVEPVTDFSEYQKAAQHLMFTYQYSDPALASGQVASRSGFQMRSDGKDEKPIWIPKGGPYGTYTFEWLTQHAWMDAVNAIPQANQNSIQNLQAAFDLFMAARSGNIVEIPEILWKQWEDWTRDATAAAHAVGDIWMTYRYSYSTTKMDVDEYTAFALNVIDRYTQNITKSRVHGHATYDGIDCNCSLTWSEKGLTGMKKFCHWLWKMGLEPNAYVAWDFVPFSFVADWFGPVGDVLDVYTAKQYRNTSYYNITDLVFSLRYSTGPILGMTADHYVRWLGEPPLVDESYWFDSGEASTSPTTTFKRVLDSGALLTGICLK